jgi:hypothetical protein
VTTYYGYYGTENREKRDMARDAEFARMQDDFYKKHSLPWPTVFGERSNMEGYGVSGIPHITVIGRDGKVHSYKIGYSPESFAEFRKDIEKLIASG